MSPYSSFSLLGAHTLLEGMATDQSAAILLSSCSSANADPSDGADVPTQMRSVSRKRVRWRSNDGAVGSGEGM